MSHGHSIRCHSPFRHYTMFHSSNSLGDFNNSIFGGFRTSTTYNINFNDGGFWGGFRNGLGLGLGNLFGGFFGGFMGNIFGGFGNMFGGFGNMFGGFGGGMGFGFPWGGGFGGGYGNYGGNGNYGDNDGAGRSGRRSRTNSDRSTNTASARGSGDSNASANCEDKDTGKLHDLRQSFNSIKEAPQQDKLQNLYLEVKKLVENPLDPSHKDGNIDNYRDLLKDINDYAKSQGWTLVDAAGAGAGEAGAAGAGNGTGDASQEGAANQNGNSGSVQNDGQEQGYTGSPLDLEGLANLVDSTKLNAAKLAGYTNYDGESEIKAEDIVSAIDLSNNTRPTVNKPDKSTTIETAEGQKHPQLITITDDQVVKYTSKGKIGCEYIYESDKDHQLYALQIKDGKYHLVQYGYHKGFGTPDWHNKK